MKWFEGFVEKGVNKLPLPEGFAIRKSVSADAEGLTRIRLEREGGEYEEKFADVKRIIKESIEVKTTHMFTAETNGEPIGYSIMRYFIPEHDAPINTAPEGWYLLGITVEEKYRRRGIGTELIRVRLSAIPDKFDTAYYFTNPKNPVSMALHNQFRFVKIEKDIVFPKRRFTTVYFRTSLAELREKQLIVEN